MAEISRNTITVSPVRVKPWVFIGMSALSMLLGIGALVRGTAGVKTAADSDLTNFFFPSAEFILRGDPWHMYAVSVGGYPNYNPPLSMFLYAPLLAVAHAVGFDKNYGELITFVGLPFLLLILVLGWLVLQVMRQLYPEAPEAQRLMAFGLVTLGPLTWQTIGTWYHLEQPLMLCLLIGAFLLLQRRRFELAGLLAGLAMLTRTTTAIPLIALGVLLILAREWIPLVRFAGVAAIVTLVGLLPFFIVAPNETSYALVKWRGTAFIGSDSVWALFAHPQGDGTTLAKLDAVARRLDMYVVILVVAVAMWLVSRRFGASVFGRESWGVLALAMLSVPMLSKTVWPYYYLEPFVIMVIWEYSTLHDRVAGLWRWPVLSVGYLTLAASLSQFIWYHSVGPLDRVVVGLTQSGAMVAVALCVWARMHAMKPEEATAQSPAEASRPWLRPARALSQPAPGWSPTLPVPPAPLPAQPAQPRNPWELPGVPPSGAQGPAWPQPAPGDSGSSRGSSGSGFPAFPPFQPETMRREQRGRGE